jgi:hypothetical protein
MVKYFYFFAFSFLLFNSACKKSLDSVSNTQLEQYFESNILNRNFTVSLAQDSSNNITSSYTGELFVLLKTDFYHGPLQATKGGIVYTGSWSCNSDYSQLIITLPNPPSEFVFLTRPWRFTSKSLPTMKLAPWGSTAPVVLNMYRQ